MSDSAVQFGVGFGVLASLAYALVLLAEVRGIGAYTRRQAEASERIAAWIDWIAKQRQSGG